MVVAVGVAVFYVFVHIRFSTLANNICIFKIYPLEMNYIFCFNLKAINRQVLIYTLFL